MVTQQQYGVVPSLDDLDWEWEAQVGVPLQDFLLCSVLPTLQKTSAAFVEPNESIDNGYGQMAYNNLEMTDNTWYMHTTSTAATVYPDEDHTLMETSQYNIMEAKHHQPEMAPVSVPEHEYPPLDSYMQHDYEHRDSNAENHDVEQAEFDGRKSTGSDCSNSSWESYGNSSQTTELSQEEIFEEIQRECAEIERRSTSPSMSTTPEPRRKSSKRKGTSNRKKELNRVAAAKYREKKRIERDSKQSELQKLESRNRALKATFTSLEGEIKYLSNLIKEVRGR